MNRYKRARELAGLSLAQAAARLGWAQGPLYAAEGGLGAPLTEPEVRIMADVYGVSIAWLQGADPVVPEATREMLRDADISFADRDNLIEFLGAVKP